MVTKHYCDICEKKLERPIDIKKVRIFPNSEKEKNFELCIDCLVTKTIPVLVSDLMFSGDDPRKFNFDQFVGLGYQQILIDFGDVKSLLKKHYGDFNDLTWKFSEE